jgi:NAD(P)-dependent dehydrogenase (short-subunit alcohol dehydrogenase family)
MATDQTQPGAGVQFRGKVALVTGAGSGIGEACAVMFGRGTARVVVADINLDAVERVAGAIRAAGGTAAGVRADVADPTSVEAMVGFAAETYGGLDIAVNNAGIGGDQLPTGEYPVEAWQRVIAVNLSGVFYCMRYELPAMVERGGGAIVNMASILGSVGFANSPAYVAAKHGVVGLTKNAALEYATRGIRVNSVGPGFIMTPLLERSLDEAARQAVGNLHPVKRMGTPEEVAEAVVWLCSDAASFVTGSALTVDGGAAAQ